MRVSPPPQAERAVLSLPRPLLTAHCYNAEAYLCAVACLSYGNIVDGVHSAGISVEPVAVVSDRRQTSRWHCARHIELGLVSQAWLYALFHVRSSSCCWRGELLLCYRCV